MGLSLPHLLLLAGVAMLLLGGGRVSALMGDVAKGVKNFKQGMLEDDTEALPPPTLAASVPAHDTIENDRKMS